MYLGYWHHMNRSRSWHRGPSRLLWFAFGAFSATLWAVHKDRTLQSRTYGHCFRVPHQYHPQVPQQTQRTQPPTTSEPRNTGADGGVPDDLATMIRNISRAINNVPMETEGDIPRTFGQRAQEEKWEEEKQRMLELGRQAGDTMADISEATLDSVLSTVEALKAKLSMHRIQREEQRKRLEQQMEEEKKKPLRWV